MKNNKHIQKFNERQENLNISDVSDSKNEQELIDMIKDIIRERNDLLKNTIYRFQRVLFRIVTW